ncbi:MAG: FAD-binding oxidoreductase [Myxococcaceae bacterium]
MLNEGLKQALMDFLGERFSEAGGAVTLSPANERELAAVLKLLRERKGRLHLDARLSRERLGGPAPSGHIGPIDVKSAVARASATVRLDALERALEARGLTLGPMSPGAMKLDVASFLEGPYAGLRAIPSGRLEPVCLGLSAMMPDGLLYHSQQSPRSAAGPDLDALYLGAGGRTGIILAATLRCFPGPRIFRPTVFSFPDAAAAVRSLRGAIEDGAWFERARLEKRGERVLLEAVVTGSQEGLERDLASISHHVFARGGRPSGQPLEAAAPMSPVEREATWDAIAAAAADGAPLVLYRLSLAAAVVAGEVQGLLLEGEAAWPAALGELVTAVDPDGILGGAP